MIAISRGSIWPFFSLVSIMPFSTRLLAEFISYRSVLIAYWGNILLLGVVLFASWRYATRAGLLREEITHDRQCAVERRIVVAQGLYAFGACLCLLNTYVSIAFIILVQLNFALGRGCLICRKFKQAHSRSDSTMCTPGGAEMAASSRALAILSAGTTR